MKAPHVSLFELGQAMDRIHTVYTQFSSSLINAPPRIFEVANAINSLHYLLVQSDSLIAAEEVELPLPASIDVRLAECAVFLKSYSTVSASGCSTERLWRTDAVGFEDAARLLKNDLCLEADKLALSLVFTCTEQQRRLGTFEEAIDVSDVLLQRHHQLRRVIREQTGRSSKSGPRNSNESYAETEAMLRTLMLRSYVRSSPLPTRMLAFGAHQIPAGWFAASKMDCKVSANLGKRSKRDESFNSMAIFRTDDYTLLEWREDNTKIMRHYIHSTNVFPHTLHSKVRDHRFLVKIRESARVVIWYDGKIVFSDTTPIDYHFDSDPVEADRDLKRFQEDLRGKDLICRVEVSEIKSKKGGALAKNQDLKLWKSKADPGMHSISFFATGANEDNAQKHTEFRVIWFEKSWYPPSQSNNRSRTIKIEFVNKPAHPQPTTLRKRRESWSPRLFFRRSRLSSGSPTSPSQMSSHGSGTLGSPEHGGLLSVYPRDHHTTNLVYLEIKFTSDAAFSLFRNEFYQAQRVEGQNAMQPSYNNYLGPLLETNAAAAASAESLTTWYS